MVQMIRDSREQTIIGMGRKIDTISKMDRDLPDIMEEEVTMRIMEIDETRNLAGRVHDGIYVSFTTYCYACSSINYMTRRSSS